MASNKLLESDDSQRRWIEEMSFTFEPERSFPTELLSVYRVRSFPTQLCSVYRVPRAFTETTTETAYSPTKIGLGAYHHLRPDLYKMHKQKLAAVREGLPPKKLEQIGKEVVSKLTESEPVIRGCYDQFIDLDKNTLAWILAIDGLFLLQYLKAELEATDYHQGQTEMESLAGDLFMLENQIPSFLLNMIGISSRHFLDDCHTDKVHQAYIEFLLNGGFLVLCQKYSPLELSSSWRVIRDTNQEHLLHRMYHLIICNTESNNEETVLCNGEMLDNDPSSVSLTTNELHPPCSIEEIHQNAEAAYETLSHVFPPASHLSVTVSNGQSATRDDALAHLLNHMYRSVNAIVAEELKPAVFDQLDKHDLLRSNRKRKTFSAANVVENLMPVEKFLGQFGVPGAGIACSFLSIISQVPWNKVSTLWGPKGDRPEVEQIEIPNVTEMSKVLGIEYAKTTGIRDAKFVNKERKLYLPAITLNAHSETILRNLLAYEAASAKPGSSLELAEYVDLMCGMIKTKKDVKLLKEAEIVAGELSDAEVVWIFKGIRKTTGEGEPKSRIGEAIAEINWLYGNTSRVKIKRKMQECGPKGMKYVNVVVMIVVVLLLSAQVFCTVFGCLRWQSGGGGAGLKYFSEG
ncbi:putative UPF0481 protein At3g02645 [Andrographis paniculata]|uniref:putative UPF0481 protein At3g02645 n=1 Tax=Andrographis paniculata TaxID=175694 RepID=UPI0021E97A32|nr:putative UPF0481 protein At3g02645 [Andrographis paniculata]